MSEPIELQGIYDAVLQSVYLRKSLSLTALFKYLWSKRGQYSLTVDIWEGALYEYSRSEKKDQAEDVYEYERSVRERCLELRRALADFSKQPGTRWRIELPKAIPSVGYQLRIEKMKADSGPTAAFWRAHLQGGRDVCVVYIEQLFYEYWPERYAVRYYDCNEEHAGAALSELRGRHPEAFKPEMVAAYPFVASGEIEARNSIAHWFDVNALVDVRSAITRRRNDKEIWESSLVLLGARPGNRMIGEVLQSYPSLDISLEESWATIDGKRFGQVRVKNPSDEEIRKFARYNPVSSGSVCTLHFSPDQGTMLAILTRIRNPYSNTAVTIINTDFGRGVEQVAHLLTDEERMRGREWPRLGPAMPDSFQILFGIPIRSLSDDHLLVKQIEPLAWRSYA